MHAYTEKNLMSENGLESMNEMFTEIDNINQWVHYPVYMLYS